MLTTGRKGGGRRRERSGAGDGADSEPGKRADRELETPADRELEMPADRELEMPANRQPEIRTDREPEMPSHREPEIRADRELETPAGRDLETQADRAVKGKEGSVFSRAQPEHLISALAAPQHGLVTRAQLLHAGLTADTVDYRVKAKRLRPVHRGVYRASPLVPAHAREMAAVLACGVGAVVSHRSAAGLWRLLPRPNDARPVDVSLPRYDRGRRPGIRAHRVTSLAPDEVAKVEGIPVTAPARTIVDLAGAVSRHELERALARAERDQLTRHPELISVIARSPGRPGVGVLRALLQEDAPVMLTWSEVENRFRALIQRARLPKPRGNVLIGGYEVGFLWSRERLVVEIDRFAFPSSRPRFERDRLRDAELAARGLQVIRVTWHQIEKEPEAMLVRLAQTLAQAGSR